MIEWAVLSLTLFAAVVVAWRLSGRIERALDRWRHPGEYPAQRARRRYIEALRAQQPFAALRTIGVPEIRAVHVACGLRHLSWEACTAAQGRAVGVRLVAR